MAYEEVTEAVALAPQSPYAHALRSTVCYHSRLPECAVHEAMVFVKLRGEHAAAYMVLGNAREIQGQDGEALQAYMEAKRLHDGYAEIYAGLGSVYARGGQFEKAVGAFDEAIRLDGNEAEYYGELAQVYQAEGYMRQAIKNWKKAKELAPERSEILLALANAYLVAEHYPEAIRGYRELLEKAPELDSVRVFLCFVLLISAWCPAAGDGAAALAFVGATVYPSPTSAPIDDASVLTSNGRITAVGKRAEVKVPKEARVIDCTGKTIVAGFWNSHVHFSDAAWNNAATAPAATLAKHMQEMLTRWGFTTVWDLGSEPANSLALRSRVESGEIPGPKMFLAGDIFPKNGHPVYLPPEMQLPEAATPEQAAQMARDDLRMSLDGMKLFTGAFMGNKPVVNMDTAIVKAAVDVAHSQGKPVFAHPQNRVGRGQRPGRRGRCSRSHHS